MDIQDNFEIEDFKYTIERINIFETRFYQILLFAIASYGTILGWSNTIGQELIPIILSFLLYILTYYGSKQRILQAHDSAYLYKKYYKKYKNIDHDSFYNYFVKYRYSKRTKIASWWGGFKSFISYPFTILLIVNIYIFFAYSFDFISELLKHKLIHFIVYISIVILFNIFVLFQIISYKRNNYTFFKNLYDEYSRKSRK